MNKGWVLLAMFLGGMAVAESFPYTLKRMKGVLLSGVTQRQSISISPGEPTDCSKEPVAGGFWLRKCKVTGAKAYIQGGEPGTSLYMEFSELTVFETTTTSGEVKSRFSYTGGWSSISHQVPLKSEILLALKTSDRSAGEIIGKLELKDYKVEAVIVAQPLRAEESFPPEVNRAFTKR